MSSKENDILYRYYGDTILERLHYEANIEVEPEVVAQKMRPLL